MPDLIMMEMPTFYTEQLYFMRLLKKNKRTSKLPVLSYGDFGENHIVRLFFLNGVNKYYQRPLKFGDIMHDFSTMLKGKGIAVGGEKETGDSKKREEAIALLLNKEKAGSEKIEIMVDYVGKLLVFPFTVNRVLKIADDSNSGAPELAKIIRTDQSMTTTILKVANSVIFASRDRKIGDIREAVVRIGFRETKNIALSMMVMKLFDREAKSVGYNRLDFWYHSLAVGVIAERIAKQAGLQNTEECFVAGLLHDFGILLMDEFFPELFEKFIDHTTKNGTAFPDSVKEIIGVSHNDLVARLFETWSIPRKITQSVVHQMDYLYFRDEADLELTKMVVIVGLANVLAKTLNVGRECDQIVHAIPDEFLSTLRYAGGFRDNFYEEIYANITMYSRFLNLDSRQFPETVLCGEECTKVRVMVVSLSKNLFEPHLYYIRNIGYSIVKDEPLENYAPETPLPDLLVLSVDDTTELNEVEHYLKEKVRIPIVLFCTDKAKCNAIESDARVCKLRKDIDVRNIDMALERSLSDKKPEMAPKPLPDTKKEDSVA